MSGLREALERIESNRAGRAAESRSVPALPPAVAGAPPPQVDPAAIESAWIATPLSIGASTQSSPTAAERTPLDDAALTIARNFAANSSVVLVGCDLSLPLAVLAANLGEALRQVDSKSPVRVDFVAAGAVASQAERLRAADGVLLAVELDRTLARAADVTAAVLRAQGVTVAGVIALR